MQETGNNEILGKKFGTLIFGSGKKIIASFKDFRYTAERYLADGRNHFLYFGDMDYEGIGIFENLAEVFKEKRKQHIFKEETQLEPFKRKLKRLDLINFLLQRKSRIEI